MSDKPEWVQQTLDVIKEYRLKKKPKAPQGYINFLSKKVKRANNDAQIYMKTMQDLEAEREGWLKHMEDMLVHVRGTENEAVILGKIDALSGESFWKVGKGAVMTPPEEHYAYMGETTPSPEDPKWRE